ncbi:hypothetical protein COV15_01940 [Candidatus Woesearchaeota archaeon CG10_big_fil_rev_8_21_14_0_10_34_12]|nr:MAG: hypothetical protein COV15_01940 [Candidatus Woesearchaeota archaeon CG10_big_fil_rev_8_21_14_0_10_34_12]
MVKEIKIPQYLKKKFSRELTDSGLIMELLEGPDWRYENKPRINERCPSKKTGEKPAKRPQQPEP